MRIVAVVTTLDNLPLLKQQIPILQSEPIDEIVVVNNGSIDSTREWLDEQEGLTVIHHDDNLGASRGRNAGLDAAGECDFILLLDGGILPLRGGTRIMLDYLEQYPDVDVISPEIATCFTTDPEKAHRRMLPIDKSTCFPQRALSSTAYALCRAKAWDGLRFCTIGPFGVRGALVEDNEMQLQWNNAGILHHDFSGPLIYRRQSGSFQRLFKETGIWPNQYGSVCEQRNVLCSQMWPQYYDLLWCATNLQISVVMLGWNEYPTFVRAIKAIHDDLADIPHEIIYVNNGSTDETSHWLDAHALRWHHGNTVIDTGTIIHRNEENEPLWTGNVVRIELEQNLGAGTGYRAGLSAAQSKHYVFLTDGDIVPAKGAVSQLYQWMKNHPEVDYVAVNPWFQEGYGEFKGYDDAEWYGMGNYGYGFAMFKREILDAGIAHPDFGPFAGAGCGYDDVEWINQIYAHGYKAYVINAPAYTHARRDLQRTGVPEEHRMAKLNERKAFLNIRWPGQEYGIIYHWNQPPEKHVRKVAVLGRGCDNPSDISSELHENLKDFCEVDCLDFDAHIPIRDNQEVTPLSGYDNYILIDSGNWDGWEVPDWCHPSIYWAIDMYYPDGKHRWPQAEPSIQLKRASKADKVFCCHKNAVEFYLSNGILAKWLAPCADPKHEYPVDSPRPLDWTALWHHCDERIPYINVLMQVHPNGFCCYKFREEWTRWVNEGKCSINLSRLGELNWRPFEIMATKVPLITNRTQELEELFTEGEHYLGFSSPEELIEKVGFVLENMDEAQAMADRAYTLVLGNHTFYHRILTMLS